MGYIKTYNWGKPHCEAEIDGSFPWFSKQPFVMKRFFTTTGKQLFISGCLGFQDLVKLFTGKALLLSSVSFSNLGMITIVPMKWEADLRQKVQTWTVM